MAGYFNWVDEVLDSSVSQGFVSKNIYGVYNTFTDAEEMLNYIESGK